MKPDRFPLTDGTPADAPQTHISTGKLFSQSGFFVLVVAVVFAAMVENAMNTLSPTMLFESYSHLSPTLGNLMGMIVIAAGILGMFVTKQFLYPKIIKSELGGYSIMLLLSIPFTITLSFIGKIPASASVASMCFTIFLLLSARLFSFYFNMNFVKYGKNGTAAGISNAAMSLSIVLESYGFLLAAEKSNWSTVMYMSTIFIIIALILAAVALIMFNKFNKK